MQVSNQVNSYEAIKAYQQPTIQPVIPENPVQKPVDKPELSPEKQLELERQLQAERDAKAAEEQAQKDQLREYAVGVTGYRSKQTQAEIYLSVATESDVSLGSDTKVLESLRDVQKQNNAIQAYAAYQENQESLKPTPRFSE
jgi:hypothetical protein